MVEESSEWNIYRRSEGRVRALGKLKKNASSVSGTEALML